MTKFKVGDKVRILDANAIMYGSKFWRNGDITKVTRIEPVHLATSCDSNGGLYVTKAEMQYIEKVSDKPTKNQRITALESEVAELKAKVEALEKTQKPSYQIGVDFARNDADITKVASQLAKLIEGETDKRRKKMSLTPNEQRKAIIAEAKAFVADVTSKNHRSLKSQDLRQGAWFVSERSAFATIKADFYVNKKKRTVTALIRNLSGGEVRAKGIAKCAPDDVFNADIGKAIALGRALGLDVSRFEQAVKPSEFAVGQIVTFRKTSSWHREFNYRIDSVTKRVGNLTKLFEGGGKANADLSDNAIEELPVIDDTEAQY